MRTTVVLAVGAGIALRCGLWFVLGTTVVLAVETGIALRFVIDFVADDFTAVIVKVKAIVSSSLASFASFATVVTATATDPFTDFVAILWGVATIVVVTPFRRITLGGFIDRQRIIFVVVLGGLVLGLVDGHRIVFVIGRNVTRVVPGGEIITATATATADEPTVVSSLATFASVASVASVATVVSSFPTLASVTDGTDKDFGATSHVATVPRVLVTTVAVGITSMVPIKVVPTTVPFTKDGTLGKATVIASSFAAFPALATVATNATVIATLASFATLATESAGGCFVTDFIAEGFNIVLRRLVRLWWFIVWKHTISTVIMPFIIIIAITIW
mmetsp:Transcript_12973/g.14561  ORF Transcript_12973/g.14561 Transcript_12973/m.14561 type:complete len:333 (-) Transcript_12973:118-1116(-)